jgi:hypothetical protein
MNRSIQKLTMVALLRLPRRPLIAQSSSAARPALFRCTASSRDRSSRALMEGWPAGASFSRRAASIVLYQPQIASWPDQKHMTLYTAVSYLAKGKQTPAIGALKVDSDTSVALEDRLGLVLRFTITEASFPTTPKDEVKAIVD